MIPLSFPRISCIKYLSFFTSIIAVSYIVIVAWGVAHFESPSRVHWVMPDRLTPGESFESIQVAFTLFLYPLLYQPNIQTVFAEMKRSTLKRSTVALATDTIIVLVTYSIIGILEYMPFAASN